LDFGLKHRQRLYRLQTKTNSRVPLFIRILNTTTMILCGYFLHYAITCPKSMLVVVFRMRNKGNRLFEISSICFDYFELNYPLMILNIPTYPIQIPKYPHTYPLYIPKYPNYSYYIRKCP
jgi:hypothetical protein